MGRIPKNKLKQIACMNKTKSSTDLVENNNGKPSNSF